ncbi:MAG: cytochrome c peroxidase [Hyphomicrobiaceae bacterium]|nr:cytochrome c peroxidase [Hyphomicrobiaceae bacterium]
MLVTSGPPRPAALLSAGALFAASVAMGFALTVAIVAAGERTGPAPPLDDLKAAFARPDHVPAPKDNPPTPEKIALGKRIFEDPIVSSNGKISCASCHDAKLSFTDGERLGRGVTGRRLSRHTPTLWNAAFSPLLFWDGRAASLEDQAQFPVSHPDEMGSTLDSAAARIAAIPAYREAFAKVFPDDPAPTARTVAMALAAYERTLVSPPTRFDNWIAGDTAALSDAEQRGFAVFAGKARCIACHNGFALTDHGFYDIGLPTADEGRAGIIDLASTRFAFKTPTLREIAWTAPYMHDGSLATLEEVVRHYERGGVNRPSVSQDMPRPLKLTDAERADLLAFLDTLSSEAPPLPSAEPWVLATAGAAPAPPVAAVNVVRQAGKRFAPLHVAIGRDETLTILNDDTRTHNVRIFDPRFDFNSGAQEPGQSVSLRFPGAGTFDAFCGIHPTMRLTIDVK